MSSSSGAVIHYRDFPVLYVDDELGNLRTFELAFRRDFTVFKAENGAEALACLASEPIAVVLSDHRMPGMTGTELLARVREIAPKTIRLLVTAYGDAATLAQAINDGCIYRYVPKPWDPEEMRMIVRQAIELYALEGQKDNLISELTTLNRVSQSIASQLEFSPLVSCLQQTIVSDLGFDGASLMLRSEDGESLSWYSSLPSVDDLSGQSVVVSRKGSPEVYRVLTEGRGNLVRLDQGFEGGAELRSLFSRVAAEEILILPLHGRCGLLGALAIDNRRGGKCFAPADEQLLQGLAAQAAIAMDNAQLVGELRNDAARTSGSDALAISGALGESMLREVRKPIARAAAGGDRAEVASAIEAAAGALDVFGVILGEQKPARSELGEMIEDARRAVKGLAEELGTIVQLEPAASIKLGVLPGRLLQLLLHMLELGIQQGEGGLVRVLSSVSDGRAVVEVASVPAPALEKPVREEGDVESLRLAACGALAREVRGSLTVGVDSRAAVSRLSLPHSES